MIAALLRATTVTFLADYLHKLQPTFRVLYVKAHTSKSFHTQKIKI